MFNDYGKAKLACGQFDELSVSEKNFAISPSHIGGMSICKCIRISNVVGLDDDQSVPTTDTGGLVENTKASGRRGVKELGKLAGRTLGICPPSHFWCMNDFQLNTEL